MAKGVDYWLERAEILLDLEDMDLMSFIELMEKEYNRTQKELTNIILATYTKMASDNNISMAAMIQSLNKKELNEFKWNLEEYREAAIKAGSDKRWIKKLDNASNKVSITHLEQLILAVEQQVELLSAKKVKAMTDTLGTVYRNQYYRNIFDLQKGIGKSFDFAKLDTDRLETILKKPWAVDGSNFSARIWIDRTKLVNTLSRTLANQIVMGENVVTATNAIMKEMDSNKFNTMRLVRTESSYFSGQARLNGYEDTKVGEYEYVSVLDHRTSEICLALDDKVFQLKEAQVGVNYPPMHVMCRATTIPRSDWSEILNGDGEDVGNVRFQTWAKDSVGNDYNAKLDLNPIPQVTLPKVQTVDS